jgi:hypothetical protein
MVGSWEFIDGLYLLLDHEVDSHNPPAGMPPCDLTAGYFLLCGLQHRLPRRAEHIMRHTIYKLPR